MKYFGPLLRSLREDARLTLADMACKLRVSVPYVSGVERSRKDPLKNAHIYTVACLLNADVLPLLEAAARDRGVFALRVDVGEKARRVGAMLMKDWGHLNEEELQRIQEVLER